MEHNSIIGKEELMDLEAMCASDSIDSVEELSVESKHSTDGEKDIHSSDGEKDNDEGFKDMCEGGDIIGDECEREYMVIKTYIPEVGMEFETEFQAFEFYRQYSWKCGFGIRKRYTNKSKKRGMVTSAKYVCMKEGKKVEDKRDRMIKEPRAEIRCGCPASMCVSYNAKSEKFRVHAFNPEHNHELQEAKHVHMIPSHKKISKAQAEQIDMADDSGISMKEAHELLSKQAGARQFVGFTKQDLENSIRSKRKKSMQFGRVWALLSYFKKKMMEDSSFTYDLQVDEVKDITNIFWADGRMIRDYSCFGDVVIFDTTFKTNKDGRPFGVFVGMNHFREIVIFGATLLFDKTSTTFEWLFQTFLGAMGGKKPVAIFTDQDATMGRALSLTMPDTHHGLCIWHIMQNAKRHMGDWFKKGCTFPSRFKECAYEPLYEDDFLFLWEALLVDFDPTRSGWLPKIFVFREQWARAYMKHVFSLGIRSTQLNESLNFFMKKYLKPNLDVTQFFTHFERVVYDTRYKESEAEYNSRHKLPKIKMNKIPMLQQASEVYTAKNFLRFQEQYELAHASFIKKCDTNDSQHVYVVCLFGQSKEHTVWVNVGDVEVTCSCCYFKTSGILCSHALKVLNDMKIMLLPERYILKRWTRQGRLGNIANVPTQTQELNEKSNYSDRYKDLCHRLNDMKERGSECHEAYSFVRSICEQAGPILSDIFEKNSRGIGTSEIGTLSLTYEYTMGTFGNDDRNVKTRLSFEQNK